MEGDNSYGVYNVKSGYHTVVETIISFVICQKLIELLWHLETTPYIQHFICRCLNNAVATNENLLIKKRGPSPMCPICNDHVEILEHLYFQCPWTQFVWVGRVMGVKMDQPNNEF